ncbi:DUF3375 family protein [Modestobacter sp. I12A-02628]|uniref:DUF3375 family protein n=1 Tax=Goekera deserti TaxID=2497753 RepID=A0A7K3WDW7_9ACTN|nr:DUF3375 family protein [Goekera deserti]NEL54675.1 DUF3375 family protein [Goekera deserti]
MDVVQQHDDLLAQRRNHSAWKLLVADNAPLVIGFLDRVFLTPNVRQLPGPELTEALEDHLHPLRGATRPRTRRPPRRTWRTGPTPATAGCAGSTRRAATSPTTRRPRRWRRPRRSSARWAAGSSSARRAGCSPSATCSGRSPPVRPRTPRCGWARWSGSGPRSTRRSRPYAAAPTPAWTTPPSGSGTRRRSPPPGSCWPTCARWRRTSAHSTATSAGAPPLGTGRAGSSSRRCSALPPRSARPIRVAPGGRSGSTCSRPPSRTSWPSSWLRCARCRR